MKSFNLMFPVFVLAAVLLCHEGSGECPEIRTREEWQAAPAAEGGGKPMKDKPARCIIIHNITSQCDTFKTCASVLRKVQKEHMEKKECVDIAFSFVIDERGMIYRCRGWTRAGGHHLLFNDRCIHVAIMQAGALLCSPSAAAKRSLKELVSCGIQKGYVAKEVVTYFRRYDTYPVSSRRDDY